MNYRTILYEKKDRLGIVTLNRPDEANAIDSQMMHEIVDVTEKIDDDEDLRVVVINGGGQDFSSGLDIKELVKAVEDVDDLRSLNEIRRRLWYGNPWRSIAGLSKPTIAAVHGRALGAGLELALACDIRIASQDTTFGFRDVQQGTIPGHGGTQRLARIVGRAKAIEMILTGEDIDAIEASRVQLVSKMVPPGEHLNKAIEIAEGLADKAPIAVKYAREVVDKGLDLTMDQGLRMETDLYILLQTTQDRAEGLRSFLERRSPKFEGK
jgi:enoyl-CoA hydratase/carnithine racemase